MVLSLSSAVIVAHPCTVVATSQSHTSSPPPSHHHHQARGSPHRGAALQTLYVCHCFSRHSLCLNSTC
ncbi:hypothetical protein OG21DRAFT_841441 [Imleria badia]|nr:hypothetical protein OG21DRAFT_841441 [Imleria badia]